MSFKHAVRPFKSHLPIALLLMASGSTAVAEESTVDAAAVQEYVYTMGVFFAAVLVMFMQAGFALLESGLSRAKNSVNVIIKNFGDLAFGTVVFCLVGYGVMYGVNESGWIGTTKFMLTGVYGAEYMSVFFQTMFAATAITICSGAMAERTSITGYLVAAVALIGFVYPVYGSWVWNSDGWLAAMGFHDFAGSTVVHSVGGWSALAAIIVLGARFGRFSEDGEAHHIPGHNLNSVSLGCFILWFGWFGFNVGSGIGNHDNLGLIALNTQVGATAGAIGAVFMIVSFGRKIQAVGIVNGVLGGLVSITAGCDMFLPQHAVFVGFVGGMLVPMFEIFFLRMRLDDVVSAVTVHGVCGIWGTLAVGLFYHGNIFNFQYVIPQLIGIVACAVFVFPTAFLLFWTLNKMGILRASTRDEQRGLDFAEHTEIAYPEFQQSKTHGG
jgi:Amt family ammonium transporter